MNNFNKKSSKNVVNKINKNNERKSTNNRPSKLLNKEKEIINLNKNNKHLNKHKSSKNLQNKNNDNINSNKSINQTNTKKTTKIKNNNNNNKKENIINKNLEKEENNDYPNKNDKENINSLNISPKTSSNRENYKIAKNTKNKTIEPDFAETKKSPIKKISKTNKVIINFDDLIEFDSKLDSIISSLSSLSSIEINKEIFLSNDCSDFFSFYFKSSLNNILDKFFSKKNRIIIISGNNLFFFALILLYHLSLNQKMLLDLLDDMKYVFSLLKINFFFLVKKIEIYYKDNFPLKCSELFNQKFGQYISINCSNEIDLISKINKNCCNITERMKLVLNYYERNNNKYYDEFSGIFKNLS